MSRDVRAETRRDAARWESFASSAQLSAANRLAEILVVGFEKAELHDRPLTELQKIDLLSAALGIFDGHRRELEIQLELEDALLDAGRRAQERREVDPALRIDEAFGRRGRDQGDKIATASWLAAAGPSVSRLD